MLHVRRPRLLPALAAIGLAGLLVVAGAPAADAHDALVSTDPEDGAVLDTPPDEISLTFSADLLDISATVLLTGPDGPVETAVAVVGTTATATVPTGLRDGGYTVAWRVVSSDGHPIQGSFGFTVGDPEAASTATTDPGSTPSDSTPTDSTPSGATPSGSTPSDSTDAGPGATSTSASAGSWLPIGIGAVVLLAAGAVIVLRRRSS